MVKYAGRCISLLGHFTYKLSSVLHVFTPSAGTEVQSGAGTVPQQMPEALGGSQTLSPGSRVTPRL